MTAVADAAMEEMGGGSDMAPSMLRGLRSRDDAQLAALIRTGIPGKMPGSSVGDEELKALIGHARLLLARGRQQPVGSRNRGVDRRGERSRAKY